MRQKGRNDTEACVVAYGKKSLSLWVEQRYCEVVCVLCFTLYQIFCSLELFFRSKRRKG